MSKSYKKHWKNWSNEYIKHPILLENYLKYFLKHPLKLYKVNLKVLFYSIKQQIPCITYNK